MNTTEIRYPITSNRLRIFIPENLKNKVYFPASAMVYISSPLSNVKACWKHENNLSNENYANLIISS